MSTTRSPLPRRLLTALLTSVLIAIPAAATRAAQPCGLLKDFKRTQLVIVAASQRCILFDVYIAVTREQRAQGLMHIRQMDPYEGMIFLYDQPAMISMWMKNTLISLDMLFIEGDGRVASIHTGAVPLAEDIISSRVSVMAVLELNAGAVDQFGLRENDRIIFPASGL
jgi:uncharacterized membrane protein (UPF0127 family)